MLIVVGQREEEGVVWVGCWQWMRESGDARLGGDTKREDGRHRLGFLLAVEMRGGIGVLELQG